MNSYNHYCYGAVDGWMYSHLAGLEATTPGFKTFDVHPRFDPRLTSVNCTYDSSYGKIESSYKINGSTINVKVTVPANTTGRLILPGDASAIKTGGKSLIEAGMKTTGAEEGSTAVELPAGRYEFSTTLK
jgi:alpha-L-rhamnosidase